MKLPENLCYFYCLKTSATQCLPVCTAWHFACTKDMLQIRCTWRFWVQPVLPCWCWLCSAAEQSVSMAAADSLLWGLLLRLHSQSSSRLVQVSRTTPWPALSPPGEPCNPTPLFGHLWGNTLTLGSCSMQILRGLEPTYICRLSCALGVVSRVRNQHAFQLLQRPLCKQKKKSNFTGFIQIKYWKLLAGRSAGESWGKRNLFS